MAYGQDVEIKLGSNDIALNEAFTITVTIKNSRLQSYKNFPQIQGFVQRGTNSSSSISFVNGRRSSTESITMSYGAQKEGTFKLKAFTMTVNGVKINSPGTTIKVGPRQQRSRNANPFGSDPFDDFFGRRNQSQEFVDVKADAFLALTSNKSEIYRGEGVTITLAFYVSNRNRADMRFHELGKQINDIVKKIKPANCWEENFNIDNITGEPITLGDKQYTQYKIYQAAFFPLNSEDLEFPVIPLEMIKYKVAKNPSFFGRNKQEDFQTFYTKAKKVVVNELPDHPLRESVSVGNFKLRETIDKTTIKTGESFNFNFDIGGRGNISGINPPTPAVSESLEIYDPAVKQNVKKGNGRITGTKAFQYYGVPNEPGDYNLSDYFEWVFFNTSTGRYDTLASDIVLTVTGESKKNQFIMSSDLGSFYDKIEFADNTITARGKIDYFIVLLNILVVIMIGVGITYLVKAIRMRKSAE